MSWSFGGLSSAVPNNAKTQANSAPNLESIETEQLGFQALNGERKVRILPSRWPAENPPSKTSSLLSVASARGLIAAAGPDSLVLCDTESVRAAFTKDGNATVDSVEARNSVSIPRISHLAFSSDENALVITAEEGGGLAIYDVGAAHQASDWTSSFQISTNGVAVRHLLPNPNKDSSHLFAIVLTDGKLLMADLKSQGLLQAASGSSVLRENVSCASWSKMGKQIVAGLADGSAIQLDVHGNEKDSIPKPPTLENQSMPVTAIFWLENPDFFLVHAPLSGQNDDADGMLPINDSIYHLVHREKETKACSFHQFSVDPCPPFLDERFPAHHFIQRIRDWQPNLDDTLIVSCTASSDIGVFTRSKVPLSQNIPSDKITHTYTTTAFADTRRAALPMSSDGMGDTYTIGMALDFSSRQKVPKPIPNDETLDESSGPLPQLCVLNQEGLLSAWWYVYNEGVQQDKPAPGLVSDGLQPSFSSSQQASGTPKTLTSLSGSTPAKPPIPMQPTFGQPSTPAFGQSSMSTFGKPSFGTPSATAFGGASVLGKSPSPWASNSTNAASAAAPAPAFGKPSFGAPSQIGASTESSFGQAGGMGINKSSPWGSNAQASAASVFGSSNTTQSPFAAFAKKGSDGNDKAAASPFAGFSQSKTNASPFASFNSQAAKASPFATTSQAKPGMPNETSFGSTVTLSSNSGSFGSGNTFGQPSLFGKPSETKEATMDDDENDDAATVRETNKSSSGLVKPGVFKLGSTFKGDGTAKDDLPKPKDVNASLFDLGLGDAQKHHEQNPTSIKKEPDESSEPKLQDIPEAPTVPEPEPAPLPPDFTNVKPEVSDSAEAAPLPPDFLSTKTDSEAAATDAPLPPDFLPPPTTAKSNSDVPVDSVETGKAVDPAEGLAEESVELPGQNEDEFEEFDGSEGEEDVEDEDHEGEDAEEDWESDEPEDELTDENDQSPVIIDPKGLSAFQSRITPASPRRKPVEEVSTTPETVQKKPSFTPAGFPKAPLHFDPPRSVEESPRSPSPVRAVTSPMIFSKSSAHAVSKPIANASKPFQASAHQSLFGRSPAAPEPESLEDDEDLRIKEILEAPVEPTDTLPDFIAHQSYHGDSDKPGIAGQLEKVYRDVNSMIDTLGLNARALQAFIAGHSETSNELGEDDLDQPDSWKLGQLSVLNQIETAVGDRLDAGKLTDLTGKINDAMEQDEQMGRVLARTTDLRKQLARRTDPIKRAQHQSSSLQAETAAQQAELRQSVQNVQNLLAQVEESMTLLRADIASTVVSKAEAYGTTAMPTVEAVTNTILKMTAMIERKSGDVDVLEAQIRRLPNGVTLPARYEEDLALGLQGSSLTNGDHSTPVKTPRASRVVAHVDSLGMSGMFGRMLSTSTPPDARPATPSSLTGSAALHRSKLFDPSASFILGRSTSSLPGSAKKKISDVTVDEVERWKTKVGRRQKVLSALRQTVLSSDDQGRAVEISHA